MVWILILNSDLRATRAGLRPTLVARRSEFNIKIHTTPSVSIIYILLGPSVRPLICPLICPSVCVHYSVSAQ